MKLDKLTRLLVFTDLDGTLLDHHTYSFLDALPQLRRLQRLGIPVIPVSSKTREEIVSLRVELGSAEPFVVENGAAVFIPQDYFSEQPEDSVSRDGYWVREWSPARETWLDCLSQVAAEFNGEFDCFAWAGNQRVAVMTGLDDEAAVRANRREYSEQVVWHGEETRRGAFIEALRALGAHVIPGGRFLSVSGPCDKGQALCWLRELFCTACPGTRVHDLAVGDSNNDVDMLEVAGHSLLVRSPVHDWPRLQRRDGVSYTTDFGPAGWAEGVARWVESFRER